MPEMTLQRVCALSGVVCVILFFAAFFIAGGIIGGAFGIRAVVRLAARKGAVTRVFTGVLFAVAACMLYRSGSPSACSDLRRPCLRHQT